MYGLPGDGSQQDSPRDLALEWQGCPSNCHKPASWIIHTERAQWLQIHHPAAVSALPQRAGSWHAIIWGAYLPSHAGRGGQPRELPPFTGNAEAFLDYPAPASLFRVDSDFKTLKVVVLDVLGRYITPWQIFLPDGILHNALFLSRIICFLLHTMQDRVHTSPYKRV